MPIPNVIFYMPHVQSQTMASNLPDFPDDCASLNQACTVTYIQDMYIRQVPSLFLTVKWDTVHIFWYFNFRILI